MNFLQKTTAVAAILGVTTLLGGVVACQSKDVSSGSYENGRELKIGGIMSLTGGAAAYGQETEKGILLAVEEINESSQGSIHYVSGDDKSDKTEAVKTARSLVEVEGVNVIVGPVISPSALSAGKYLDEMRVPMVSTSAIQDEVTVSDSYDRVFVSRVCFNNTFQGTVLAEFAFHDLGLRSVATIYDKTLSYSIGVSGTFKQVFEDLGGTVSYEENYSVSDTDYSSLIQKVSRFEVDALFIPGWDENVGPMLKQAGDRWDHFTLLGPESWPSNRLLSLAAGNIKTAYALSHYFPDDTNERVQAFNIAYNAKYGETPSPFAALGYDAIKLIWDAHSRAESSDSQSMMAAINATRNLTVVTGTITLDEHRNAVKDAVILRVHPDRFVFHKRIVPGASE